MADRLTIRSISPEVLMGLETLAAKNERSLESEARYALRSWVESLLLMNQERSGRRAEASARLQELLLEVNRIRSGPFLRPSHIAEGIGEEYVETVEQWFTGEKESSFSQLDAIGKYLGGVGAWLRHGDGQPFPITYQRLPEDPEECVQWLRHIDGTQKVSRVHLVRSLSKEGQLAIVKQDEEWRCQTYVTPCHVSEEVGADGERTLASLSLSLRLLYKVNSASSSAVTSYLLEVEDFMRLIQGRVHPLTVLHSANRRLWWEDLWDEDQFRRERATVYWHGWRSLCERIASMVEDNASLREQRNRIASAG